MRENTPCHEDDLLRQSVDNTSIELSMQRPKEQRSGARTDSKSLDDERSSRIEGQTIKRETDMDMSPDVKAAADMTAQKPQTTKETRLGTAQAPDMSCLFTNRVYKHRGLRHVRVEAQLMMKPMMPPSRRTVDHLITRRGLLWKLSGRTDTLFVGRPGQHVA